MDNEAFSYESILERMLDRVSDEVDKREGSLIFSALSSAAAELAQMYIEISVNEELSFVDSATEEILTRKCAEFGVNRFPATKAKREGLFCKANGDLFDVPIGSRFSIEDLNYITLEKINSGKYVLECETVGTIGNKKFGPLLPLTYMDGLAFATLGEVLVPGEDEETDEQLRDRYYEEVNEPAFGGNVSDYKRKIHAINGVGGTKIFPAWKGGGTVKCVIISSDYNAPSVELVNNVQTIIDPVVNQGKGIGLAPIGHRVSIEKVKNKVINIQTTITLSSNTVLDQVRGDIENVIEEYFLFLRKGWSNQDQIIVRTSQIEARILTIQGIEDVNSTLLNSLPSNVTLGEEEIPVIGTVTINV
ncbi:baseplate J/gp47 family protein [Heyndrickxia sporothermodurans]